MLTGSLSDAEHYAAISDGKVEGNQLSWSAKVTKPMRMSFKFTATVEADRISGAAKHLLGKRRSRAHALNDRRVNQTRRSRDDHNARQIPSSRAGKDSADAEGVLCGSSEAFVAA